MGKYTFKDVITKFKSGYREWCTKHVSFKQIYEKPDEYLSSRILLPQVAVSAKLSRKKPGVPSEQFITSVKIALVDNAKVYQALSSLDELDIVSADRNTELPLSSENREAIEDAVSRLLPVDHHYDNVGRHLETELTVLRVSLKDTKLKDFYQACFFLRRGLVKFFGF